MKLGFTAKTQQKQDYYSAPLHSLCFTSMFERSSAFQNNRWNLGFLRVLSICEICFYQRFKAPVSPLTQVEHKDKKKHQETDEDSSESGAQHEDSRPSICICGDETRAEMFAQAFAAAASLNINDILKQRSKEITNKYGNFTDIALMYVFGKTSPLKSLLTLFSF